MPELSEVIQSDSILKFAPAFVKAQCDIRGAAKDKENPHFKSQYADLSSVMDACKESLNKQGIAIIQTPAHAEAGRLALTTRLLHESGEWIAGVGDIPVDRAGPQAYGSALTYARRYFLAAMVGVCPEDDDANGATGELRQPQRQQAPQRPPQKLPQQQQSNEKNPKEMTEGEKFVAILTDAFDSAGFSPIERTSIVAATCKKKKVPLVTQLSDADRKSLLDAIVNGTIKPKQQQAA